MRSKSTVAPVAGPSWAAAQDRHPFLALPEGWTVLGRCRFGTGVPGPHATGCYALAHPQVGVALIDIVPNATPNAEARLRRALTAVEFWPDFPGNLPVVHDRLDVAALRGLPWVLDRWFAALPVLTVPGGSAWIEGVRRAMEADPAWELPGRPKTVPDAPPAPPLDEEGVAVQAPKAVGRASNRPRRWGRMAALPVAFVAVFAAGLVSGFVLLESPAPVGQHAAGGNAPPQGAAASATIAASPEAAPKPAEATAATAVQADPAARPDAQQPVAEAALSVPASELERGAAVSPVAPRPAEPPSADAVQGLTHAAVEAAAGQLTTGSGAGVGSMAALSLERRVSLATPMENTLPMAPPRAPAPPPLRTGAQQASSRPASVIDRACSQALFRFQQGERLTSAEQNFIRTGCSTARR